MCVCLICLSVRSMRDVHVLQCDVHVLLRDVHVLLRDVHVLQCDVHVLCLPEA